MGAGGGVSVGWPRGFGWCCLSGFADTDPDGVGCVEGVDEPLPGLLWLFCFEVGAQRFGEGVDA